MIYEHRNVRKLRDGRLLLSKVAQSTAVAIHYQDGVEHGLGANAPKFAYQEHRVVEGPELTTMIVGILL